MKNKVLFISFSILIIILILYKLKSNQQKVKESLYKSNPAEAVKVVADTIRFAEEIRENYFSGIFEASRETRISADVQGRILNVLCDVGDQVKSGQTLIQLDHSLLDMQLQSVRVQIRGLEADNERYTILAGMDAIQRVQLEKTQLALESAYLQEKSLLLQIEKTNIRSPFNGIITAKLSESGSFAAPGVPLIQLTSTDDIRFLIQINENQLSQFNQNNIYTITPDALPNHKLNAVLKYTGGKTGPGFLFPVQFYVKNDYINSIKPGMLGRLKMKEKTAISSVSVALSSILYKDNFPYVYKINNQKAYLTPVHIIEINNDLAIIDSGLLRNDIIVKNGLMNLYDGASVIF